MRLTEILQYLLVRSGQFIVGDVDALGMTIGQLWSVMDRDIQYWEKYNPLNKKFNITMSQKPSSATLYDFTRDTRNPGYKIDNPQTITVSQSLIATSTQTFQVTLPNGPITPETTTVLIDTVPAAIEVSGALQFGVGFENYSGVVDYENKKITITVVDVLTPITIDVTVNCQYTVFGNPPEFISKVVPVGFRQVMTNWWQFKRTGGFPGKIGRVPLPRPVVPEYRKPILYLSEPGKMDVEVGYRRHRVLEYEIDNPLELKDAEVVDLQEDQNLLDLLLARFWITLGNSRSAFVHNDMPVVTNADAMIDQGQKLYEEAEKKMFEQQEWWLGVRL